MKVTVVVGQGGKVVAARVMADAQHAAETGGYAPEIRFLPRAGQQVLELDVPDEDLASRSPDEALRVLQEHKDRAGG
jgi:hypothetical protein